MPRVITQQTFDDAVKENINEFSMSSEEAVQDAIKQFESQGVSLQNIITNSLLTSEVDTVTKKIDKLKELIVENPEDTELLIALNEVKSECNDGIAKRVLAGQCGLYDTLVGFLSSNVAMNENLKISVFESLISLMTGYPDLLDASGFNIIEQTLKYSSNQTLLLTALKWSVECCIKHEQNRERFLNNENVISSLKEIIEKDTLSPDVLRILCKLFQTFVLNDDIRAEFPMAHKHACQISNDFLHPLILRLRNYKTDKNVLIAVLQALIAIIVRNEYCQHFADAGGLELLREIMVKNSDDEALCRSCFSLVKVVAGNDQVKAKVVGIIDPTILIPTIHRYLSSDKTCSRGLAALAMLTLRNSYNCKLLSENNVAELIVQAMKIHSANKKILKNVCWLIKNLAQGNEKVSSEFLNFGVENCLREILQNHEDCVFEANIALRLLGCDVESKEIWTGEGKGVCN